MFNKLFLPFFKPTSKVAFALSTFMLGNYLNQKYWKVQCLETVRVNKPEFIKLINSTKEEVLILIYNRESEDSLESQILKLQEEAEKLKIEKLALLDHNDLRHLETFTKIMRDEFEETKENVAEPRNLQGKIKIMYINPTFDTTKPFMIKEPNELKQQIEEIRNFVFCNPTEMELKRSLKTFNRTTVIKNCYNQTCVEEFKEKVRKLIEVELLRDKLENFGFYYTNSKNDAAKISNLINQSSNKQEIYVYRNDMLGHDRQLETVFNQEEGHNYSNESKFMMLIRPRVHILSKAALNTDLYWYISCTKLTKAPTFSINNTKNNLPAKIIEDDTPNGKESDVVWLKGHYREVELIKRIKEKYGRKLEVLVAETTLPSELFRHLYQPERYCIFSLAKKVPYPKLFIRPSTLTINMKTFRNMVKVEENERGREMIPFFKIDAETEDYSEKWNRIMQKIDKFVEKPQNYSHVRIYKEKEIEINGEELLEKLKNQHANNDKDQKWVFRVCGAKNNCLYTAYEKYGLELSTPVYALDSEVQNISIDEGDYVVENGFVNPLN